MTFGELLRDQRLAAGLTQAGLAERAGISERGVQSLERGVARPRSDTLARLLRALNVSDADRPPLEAAAMPQPRPAHAPASVVLQFPKPGYGPPGRSALPPNNLPAPLGRFIGRERELRDVEAMLAESRLVTLTGPGGSGKTRLAIEVATRLLDHFADGVFLISLAEVSQSEQLPLALARTLGLRVAGARTALEVLMSALRARSQLLLFDNFEHLVAAAPGLVQLLTNCPQVRILVTSRAALQLRGELEYALLPLSVPRSDVSAPRALESEAVQLFVDRARAVRPNPKLDAEDLCAVAGICLLLDGLPLAIELAAAQTRLLPPRALLARLSGSDNPASRSIEAVSAAALDTLHAPLRDLPARQQTMRRIVAWSYDLLDGEEQRLFRQVSVFSGGCTLDAIEHIATNVRSVHDRLTSLAAKSLLRPDQQPDGQVRIEMLETIRAYGLAELAGHGEELATRGRHAAYYVAFAEESDWKLSTAEGRPWIRTVAAEMTNLRAAVRWLVDCGEADVGLGAAAALGRWYLMESAGEGRQWLQQLLAHPRAAARATGRARALQMVASLAMAQGDYRLAHASATESVDICRAAQLSNLLVGSLSYVALCLVTRPDDGRPLVDEALRLARTLGDERVLCLALLTGGIFALRTGDEPSGSVRLRECIEISSRPSGDLYLRYAATVHLGFADVFRGDRQRARQRLEEALPLLHEFGDGVHLGGALIGLGLIAVQQGRTDEASAYLREALRVFWDAANWISVARALDGLSAVALARRDSIRGARLAGAAQAVRLSRGLTGVMSSDTLASDVMGTLRATLSDAAFAMAWQEGLGMPADNAISYALQPEPQATEHGALVR